MGSTESTCLFDFADGLEGWQIHDPLANRVHWLGRDALMLGGGCPVIAPVVCEPPYSLGATVSGGEGECYVGFCFHLADLENYETVYFAPHAGGHPYAIQYDPVINGSTTWQIFGDADGVAVAPLDRQRWHLVRLDVWPDVAQVYVDNETTALATFTLRSGLRRGRFGLWGYLPSYVADIAIRPLEAPPPPPPAQKATPPAGVVQEWLVARLDSGAKSFVDVQASVSEHNGTLCFNRMFRAEPGTRAYAAFEVEIGSDPNQRVTIEVGYSDKARIWYDGTLIHEGDWRWDMVAGTDGRIRSGHHAIPVSSTAGTHFFLAEITALEPGFGWGLTARVVADGRPCVTTTASGIVMPGLDSFA